MSDHLLLSAIHEGDRKALARAITLVENESSGYEKILADLSMHHVPVIGFTGPPGSGKSSLINKLIELLSSASKKTAVLAVDPTSPFNYGSLLGDRLRMSEHFNDPNIFIRSVATRGSLGGLSEKTIEITDVLRSANFDYIIIETVGVGQSEVEIAGLADTTVVVNVPESGDEIQTMKSGIMEIADVFVVNKCDRPGADMIENNLRKYFAHPRSSGWKVPVVKTSATQNIGISELQEHINEHLQSAGINEKRIFLFAEKAWRLIQKNRMESFDKKKLMEEIKQESQKAGFNLYRFIADRNIKH